MKIPEFSGASEAEAHRLQTGQDLRQAARNREKAYKVSNGDKSVPVVDDLRIKAALVSDSLLQRLGLQQAAEIIDEMESDDRSFHVSFQSAGTVPPAERTANRPAGIILPT